MDDDLGVVTVTSQDPLTIDLLGEFDVSNIVRVDAAALTRIRVELKNRGAVNEKAIADAGTLATMFISDQIVHLVVGDDAPALGEAMQAARKTA